MNKSNLLRIIENFVYNEVERVNEVIDMDERSIPDRLKDKFFDEGLDTVEAVSSALEDGDTNKLKKAVEEAFDILDDQLEGTELGEVANLFFDSREDAISSIIQDLLEREEEERAFHSLNEAEYQGRKVTLNKPMRGDVKKFKVFVKDPKTGKVKKVNFGDPNMRIKKSNPKRRKSFRARHNCDNPGPKTKARFWSCRKW